VRALIDYGRQIVTTLRDSHPTLSAGDVTVILARIARGLLLAEVLEARITQGAPRLDAEPRPRRTPAPHRPRPTTALPPHPLPPRRCSVACRTCHPSHGRADRGRDPPPPHRRRYRRHLPRPRHHAGQQAVVRTAPPRPAPWRQPGQAGEGHPRAAA